MSKVQNEHHLIKIIESDWMGRRNELWEVLREIYDSAGLLNICFLNTMLHESTNEDRRGSYKESDLFLRILEDIIVQRD